MLLIGAITIAVLFLTLSIVLNGSLHAPTVAGEASESVSAGTAVTLNENVHGDVEALIDRATTKFDDNSGNQQTDFVEDRVGVLDHNYRRYYAEEDRILSLSSSVSEGTHVYQESGSFRRPPPPPLPDWDITTGQTRARNITLFPTGNGPSSAPATLVVDDGGGEWEIDIDYASDAVTVRRPGGATATCTAPSLDRIEVANASINGDHCNALDFFEETDGDYKLEMRDGNELTGGYNITVLGSANPAADSHSIVYGADVTISERSPELRFDRTIWAAPGEPR
jgi:hypothetical protein